MEQSAGRCHFVAITADIPETAEDRTVRSELLIAPAASDTLFLLFALLARPFVFVLFSEGVLAVFDIIYATLISFVQ